MYIKRFVDWNQVSFQNRPLIIYAAPNMYIKNVFVTDAWHHENENMVFSAKWTPIICYNCSREKFPVTICRRRQPHDITSTKPNYEQFYKNLHNVNIKNHNWKKWQRAFREISHIQSYKCGVYFTNRILTQVDDNDASKKSEERNKRMNSTCLSSVCTV